MIEAVLFDLDGTLYQSEKLTGAIQHLAFDLLASIRQTSVENAKRNVQRLMPESLSFTKTIENLGLPRQIWYKEAVKRINPCRYLKHDERNAQLMVEIQERGLKRGVVTNSGKPWAKKILVALGFPIDSFDVIVDSFMAEPKPSMELFELALKLLNLQPNEAIYIGDRTIEELMPAKKVGVTTILVSADGVRRRWSDFVVETIYDLPALLDKLSPTSANPLVLRLSDDGLLEGQTAFLDRELYLSDMQEDYPDKKAITNALKQKDILVFKGRKPILPLSENWLNFSLRSLQPGKIGSDFIMEPGHFHDCTSEIYLGVSGCGKMLLEFRDKQSIIDFGTDDIVFIPPQCGHRMINTGKEELRYLCVYPSTARSSNFQFQGPVELEPLPQNLVSRSQPRSFDAELREVAYRNEISDMNLIINVLEEKARVTGKKSTLLAISPNSEAVVKAAILAAKSANAPLMFTATLNQVDLDGGYTGWTPESFVDKVRSLVAELQFAGPCLIALDHGGPWLKDIQRRERWSLNRAMSSLKTTLTACLEAGYSLFHIDPTVDITLEEGELLSAEIVVEHIVELIKHIEQYRNDREMPPVAYEVGTEEVCGGLTNSSSFRRFLEHLRNRLGQEDLGNIWPSFIVASIGTDLNTSSFNPETASEVVKIAEENGLLIKGHYTDWVSHPEKYPIIGIGGANVGPEFTVAEFEGLQELIQEEVKLDEKGRIKKPSNLQTILKETVVQSGRWVKWLQADEIGMPFNELSLERQKWLIQTGCRYIWSHPAVSTARRILYRNLQENNIDAEQLVLTKIVLAMQKYFHAFNLQDLNRVIYSGIPRYVV